MTPQRVSIHGGHSGQFCDHAKDSLEDIIKEYIKQGFLWVGITEHTPPPSTALLDPGQVDAGLTPESLLTQFENYFAQCRRLQKKYRDQITIYVAMEIETYSGYETFIPFLMKSFQPDYIVGSVHFVSDICFDYSKEQYKRAVAASGSLENLYCDYFDQQFEMLKKLRPNVVGHFDLIRIFDPDYKNTLNNHDIQYRIERNLGLIRDLDLILDYNLRSLLKGASEPYISKSILKRVKELGISVVVGDDSHGINSVGANLDQGIEILHEFGFTTNWREP